MSKLTRPTPAQITGRRRSLLADAIRTHLDGFVDLMPIDAVADFGFVPDFDPSTSVSNGTNNTVAFQKMINNVVAIGGNCRIRIPSGKYRFAKVDMTLEGNVTVALGRPNAGLRNVLIEGDGFSTVLHHDSVGRMFGLYSAQNVVIRDMSVIGYGGGDANRSRERDSGFSLGYSCRNVTFEDMYIDNHFGDCIYFGGDLQDGAVLGKFSRDVTVRNCILKERYGNGIRSYDPSDTGTRSRLALAVIDIVGLKVHDNIIFGEIDLEPNSDGQNLQYVHIHDNEFRSGEVSPTDNPYQCEQLYQTSGKVIRGGITSQSVAATITSAMITIENNSIQYGRIRLTATPARGYTQVRNNRIRKGGIFMGHYSGTNENPGMYVVRNHVDAPFDGSDDANMEDWIKGSVPSAAYFIQGAMTYGRFLDNTCGGVDSGFSYMLYRLTIDDAGKDIGLGGRNVWSGNKAINTQNLRNYSIAGSDMDLANITMPSSGRAKVFNTNSITGLKYDRVHNKDVAGSVALDFNEFTSNKLKVTHEANATITGISNPPNTELGTEIQIRSGSATSSNKLTLKNSSAFYLTGESDVELDSTRKIVTFQLIEGGVWTEVHRNF